MAYFDIDDISPTQEGAGPAFIADEATVIGNVILSQDCSIWFGCVIRGDNEPITIGPRTNVQEHCVFHTDPGFPVLIGEGCTIGHRAMLHGCTIGQNSLIGIGAIVLNGAKIGRNSLVGAGALVTEGKTFEDNSLIVGSPARTVRTLDDDAIAGLRRSADHYVENGKRFAKGFSPVRR